MVIIDELIQCKIKYSCGNCGFLGAMSLHGFLLDEPKCRCDSDVVIDLVYNVNNNLKYLFRFDNRIYDILKELPGQYIYNEKAAVLLKYSMWIKPSIINSQVVIKLDTQLTQIFTEVEQW